MADYENMTVEQLEKENQKLMAKRREIVSEQRILNAVRDRKIIEAKAKATIEGMTDSEKAALTQVLSGAGGIGSEEKVGTPGAE